MLRSLVGSEMCIRDSAERDLHDLSGHREADQRARDRARRGEEGERQREPCLLYTSDAADDLLCVDLGGRRIIKKKNNRQKRRRT